MRFFIIIACVFFLQLHAETESESKPLPDVGRMRPSSWATPIIGSALENWYKVDDRVYRSKHPQM